MKKTIVLEPSTNTHLMEANDVITNDLGNGILQLKVKGDGIITHGEHGTIKTQSPDVIKYVQQELNPITQMMRSAFD